jgi:hypothetical protein
VGSGLEFQIDYGGYPGPVIGTDRLDYPTNLPTITGVSGCTDSGNATTGCATSGGQWITITGYNLGTPLNVFVSGDQCAPTRNQIGSSSIQCQLGPGTGYGQSVTLTAAARFSAPVKYLSFAAPSITSVTGCIAESSVHTSKLFCLSLWLLWS